MKTLSFKCTLLSDVVLSASPATEGQHKSLDFIPGSNFLGIVAAQLYKKEDALTAFTLFHSGKVRFGDAHPALDGQRSLRVPASFYKPKLKTQGEERYVHHHMTPADHEALRPKQLKQCRTEWYAFSDTEAREVKVEKRFFIKSAYDSTLRRAKDEQMFGYESIARGTEFLFSVEIADEAEGLADKISDALTGTRHLGRSRSAQYGWVKIEPCEFAEPEVESTKGREIVEVYADGRLIFFDDNGRLTFQPTPADLGIETEGAHILWNQSQVRTFQYAPWNYTRRAYDNDRCGIEKGSVFIVNVPGGARELAATAFVGAYRNEGFGKVVYNPAFLRAQADKHGQSVLTFTKAKEEEDTQKPCEETTADTPLLRFLRGKNDEQQEERNIYEEVNEFVKSHTSLFLGERFASQWGTIRGIAMATSDPKKLWENVKKYLTHGVAEEKWADRGRYNELEKFVQEKTTDSNLQDILINLASEMAKAIRRKEK